MKDSKPKPDKIIPKTHKYFFGGIKEIKPDAKGTKEYSRYLMLAYAFNY